jgi:hypothetical protein
MRHVATGNPYRKTRRPVVSETSPSADMSIFKSVATYFI